MVRPGQLGAACPDRGGQPHAMLRSLYVNLLDEIESHTLAVLPDTERPLPEYIADRLGLHAALVDAIDRRDRDRALELIARHKTSDTSPVPEAPVPEAPVPEAPVPKPRYQTRRYPPGRYRHATPDPDPGPPPASVTAGSCCYHIYRLGYRHRACARRGTMAEPATGQRGSTEFSVAGQTIAALTAGPAAAQPASGQPISAARKPLIAALHGGTYTARYYDVAGSGQGGFLDVAAAAGYPVVAFDRPGYGGSTALGPAENTFTQHAALLSEAITQAAAQAGADRVFLTGHSIGGMIAMMIAAGETDFRLTGLSVTGMGAVIRRGGAAHALASLPPDETVDLPYDQRDQVMFGPPGSWTAEAVQAAHGSYALTPVVS